MDGLTGLSNLTRPRKGGTLLLLNRGLSFGRIGFHKGLFAFFIRPCRDEGIYSARTLRAAMRGMAVLFASIPGVSVNRIPHEYTASTEDV